MCDDDPVDGSSLNREKKCRTVWRAALVLFASGSVACGHDGLPCASSIGAYCASTPEAVCNWSLYNTPGFSCRNTRLNESCGPTYLEAYMPSYATNLILFSYYDRPTGQLVAVLSQLVSGPVGGADSLSCVAGPDWFSRPSCPGDETVALCYDGGVL
jgi:hypothetical protein